MPTEQEIDAAAAALPSGETLGPALARINARAALEAADRVRAPASFACADATALRARHRTRAKQAIAQFICACDLTDGFCSPRDGKCHWENNGRRGLRTCSAVAEGALKAMEGCGMSVVWDYDPTLRVTMEKRP